MSWRLVAEVLYHAPPMTAAERLTLAAVAEQIPAGRRENYIVKARLQVAAGGMSERGLRDTFERLTKTLGVDIRVPTGVDKLGRPKYAHRGASTVYRLPEFPAPAGCSCQVCEGEKGGATVPPFSVQEGGTVAPEGGTPARERRRQSAGKAAPQRPPARSQGEPGSQTRASAVDGPPPEPPERCPQHIDDPNPGPCGPCRAARIAHDRWTLAKTEWYRTAPRCPRHPGENYAHNCRPCRSEQLGAT